MKKEGIIFIMFLLVSILLMTIISFRYSTVSRQIPLVIGTGTFALLGLLLFMEFSTKVSIWFSKFDDHSIIPELDKKKRDSNTEIRKREISLVFWLAGLALAIYFIGFSLTLPLFLLLFLKIKSKESWLLSIIIAAVTGGILYFMFFEILRVPTYHGYFFR
jgi:hypothetical protein